MRRLVALGIALCLCAPCLGHAEGKIQPYTFDRTDRQQIYESSGTGGTVSHEGSIWGVPNQTQRWNMQQHSSVPENLREPIHQWKQQAFRAWGIRAEDVQEEATTYASENTAYRLLVSAAEAPHALVCVELFAWITDEATGDEATYLQTAVFDPVRGKQLALSDFFYDGFHYIDYINGWIANRQQITDYHIDNSALPIYEENMRTPFSGLPNDYPLFVPVSDSAGADYLQILYDSGNPFWQDWDDYAILVPLTPDISPYAVRDTWRVTLRHQRQELSGEQYALKPIVTINEGEDVPRDDVLNAALTRDFDALLQTWEQEGLLRPSERWVETYPALVEDRYLTVRAYLLAPGDEAEITIAFAEVNAYRLDTGEPLDVAAVLTKWQADDSTAYYTEEEHEDEYGEPFYVQPKLTNYRLPSSARIRGFSLQYLEETRVLCVELEERSGRVVWAWNPDGV